MKPSLWLIVILAVALTCPPSVVAQSDIFKFKGQSAYAIFSTTDGCVITETVIGASEGYNHTPPGSMDVLSSAFLTTFRWNTCTGETLIDIAGDVPLAVNEFTASQQSARLRTVINVYDRVSNSFFEVSVDIQWSSTGAVIQHRERTHDRPNCVINSYIVGTSIPAQATGSISVHQANVIPAPSVEAMVMTAHEGMVGMNCPIPG
jgi:hypothetical protein